MSHNYQKILDFMVGAGKDLIKKSGNIKDIGVTKRFLTEEDLKIERGINAILKTFGNQHAIFAEEENDLVKEADDLWVVDPISGTESFINGTDLYTIVVSHVHNGIAQFAAVYYPAKDELFTAYLGQGAKVNGQLIRIKNDNSEVIKVELRISKHWKDKAQEDKVMQLLFPYKVSQYNHSKSMALSYCELASGRYDGVISMTRDCFPEFAGALIIREAGGKFTNIDGESNFNLADRIFVGGNEKIYQELLPLVKQVLREEAI
ncbi:MAG: inositol monophosphatase [Patescibacteria group bacterium]|jgi:myo-inositol-1(or 4)-monophosphatase